MLVHSRVTVHMQDVGYPCQRLEQGIHAITRPQHVYWTSFFFPPFALPLSFYPLSLFPLFLFSFSFVFPFLLPSTMDFPTNTSPPHQQMSIGNYYNPLCKPVSVCRMCAIAKWDWLDK